MQQVIFIALILSIFALITKEICDSVRAIRYHQTLSKKRNTPFDIYAMEFEEEAKSRMYKTAMDSKYNEQN